MVTKEERIENLEKELAALKEEVLSEKVDEFLKEQEWNPKPEPDIPGEDSLAWEASEIGNQVHNLSCEHQHDDELSARLGTIASALWSLARRTPQPVPEGYVLVPERLIEPGDQEGASLIRAGFRDGWNACRAKMLSAVPKSCPPGQDVRNHTR